MKPILFNTEMVRAILGGSKTTTRRVIKPQPEFYIGDWDMVGRNPYQILTDGCGNSLKPVYQISNILYVRETWGISNFDEDKNVMTVQYKVDGATADVVLTPDKFQKYYDSMTGAEPDYRPSIFMPKEAARIFLRVTYVKAEQLQDITEGGAKLEGAKEKRDFIRIWNNTIPDEDSQQLVWSANPWVWVISFERCEKPEI
jgi:hypothetical protein